MIVLCRLYSLAGKTKAVTAEKVNLQAYNDFFAHCALQTETARNKYKIFFSSAFLWIFCAWHGSAKSPWQPLLG